ncbi:MAG: MFS transporter [Bacillota bacterium]|nr:MFS transporter [Bacillota bacterium]
MEKKRSLSVGTYIGYGIGSVGTGIFATVPGLLLLSFMVRYLQIPPALAGTVIMIPRLWDVITDPFAGSLSDRTRSRWGARRPWMLAGALTLPVAFALLFRVPEQIGTEAAWYLMFIYILCTTFFTIYQVPYVSMPAEMSEDYYERTTIMSWRVAFLTLGILVGGAAAPEIISAGGGGRDGFALMGIVVGVVLFLVLIGSFFGTARVPKVEPVAVTASFREQLRAAGENKPYFILFGAYIIQVLGIGAMLAGVDFFSSYILGDPGQTSILFVCLIGPALITMPLWVRVGRRFGKLSGYIICTVLFALGGLFLMLASPNQLWLVYLIVFVMGAGYAGTQLFPFSMLPDTISADTLRTGMRRAGAFTGLWTAADKAGFAVGPAIFAAILAVTGFIETEGGVIIDQPASALMGVRIGFALLPALLMALSIFFLRRYKLDPETIAALGLSEREGK